MLLTGLRRAAPPIASAASARHPFGPTVSQAASVEDILFVAAFWFASARIGNAETISVALNKMFTFGMTITGPVLLISDSSKCRGSGTRRSVRRREPDFE